MRIDYKIWQYSEKEDTETDHNTVLGFLGSMLQDIIQIKGCGDILSFEYANLNAEMCMELSHHLVSRVD